MYKISRLRLGIVTVVSYIGLVTLLPSAALAQQIGAGGTSGNGIRVSPVRTEYTLAPGESRQLTLTVQNLTSTDATYQAIINDFVAGNNELGQPALILDADKFAPSHSLKRYIAPVANVDIAAGKTKEVKVTITMPKDVAGGGYYGAVRFTPAGSAAGKNVTLSASVGSLILVRVPGDIVENVTLVGLDVRSGEDASAGSSFFTSNKKLYGVARFKNAGNVHEQPFGKMILKKGGKVVQTMEINSEDPRGNVLPDSVRRFTVKLDKVGLWGSYTLEGNFGYGSNGQLLSGKTSFFVLPLLFIVIGLLLVAGLVWAVVGLPKAIKRYNANVVRRANRR